MNDDKPLRVAIPPGIGDSHWALQKIRGLSKHHGGRLVDVYVGADVFHNTVHYVNLVPFVNSSFEDRARLSNITATLRPHYLDEKWSTLAGCRNWKKFDYLLHPNGHLENGHRIETFMPEIETDFTYELKIGKEVFDLVGSKIGRGRILLFLGGVEPNNSFHGGWWKVSDWAKVIELLNSRGLEPAIIGGNNGSDSRYMAMVEKEGKGRGIQFTNLIGMTNHAEVCALIKMASCWCGLNSGTGIVSAMQGTPTVMLWSDSDFKIPGVNFYLHPNMKTSWLADWQLEKYRTVSYGDPRTTPEKVVDLILEVLVQWN